MAITMMVAGMVMLSGCKKQNKMTKRKYGIIKTKKPEFPQRDLLKVPHGKGILTVAYPAFGTDYFGTNVGEMQKDYSHPQTGKRISFREPTTFESISAAAYDFENLAKPKIFDSRWLQIGYIVRTSEGVFVNPPRDKEGNIINEKILKSYLNNSKKVNGIYLGENDFGFAPYETFERGIQDGEKFAEGGLARVLEHTSKKQAKNLREIASTKFYKIGVNVCGFDDVKESALRVVGLVSGINVGDGRLGVIGDDWSDDCNGYAFGVLK